MSVAYVVLDVWTANSYVVR